jgi:elongation factor Ts
LNERNFLMADVTATMVKSLRTRTGAGMMDCKNALLETGGDEEKAVELIQKKGLAKAAKKAGAIAAEGVIQSYVHPGSRIGVLVEVNCQTDFVARNEEFKEFAENIALQIASMAPQFVRREDIPEDQKQKQRAIFEGQLAEEEEKSGKKRPEAAIEQILEGKLNKWMAEGCLLEQSFIHDDKKTVQQVLDELTAKIGEKLDVRRFTRYELGEGVETKKKDLASEVAEALGKS